MILVSIAIKIGIVRIALLGAGSFTHDFALLVITIQGTLPFLGHLKRLESSSVGIGAMIVLFYLLPLPFTSTLLDFRKVGGSLVMKREGFSERWWQEDPSSTSTCNFSQVLFKGFLVKEGIVCCQVLCCEKGAGPRITAWAVVAVGAVAVGAVAVAFVMVVLSV